MSESGAARAGGARKLRVGVVFGGRSTEHEISIMSARNVVAALDPMRFETVLIGIDKNGRFRLHDARALGAVSAREGEWVDAPLVTLAPRAGAAELVLEPGAAPRAAIDVVFPVLHGPLGEDGTVQGLLELLDVPYVGSAVLGSALGMDKDVAKRLLRAAGIPVGPFVTLRKAEFEREPRAVCRAAAALGFPLFTKPANAGSSVGVRRVTQESDVESALLHAFAFDTKALAEVAIEGREIEVAVLGNEEPLASVPGEIVVQHADGFYSYEAKYLDEHGALLKIPAELSSEKTREVQALALATFLALECRGLSRVDFFLRPNGELLVNEINTMPGFTAVSMYPKLWEASGIGPAALVARLIELAFERKQQQRALCHDASGR
ncbi:MAG TPA: D-alanine--D-alanine ligase family protein [Polyangiaceae bacterium]|nr:D-alanine--D-alanine ligase family protein [Polyangiaceae bacterium]